MSRNPDRHDSGVIEARLGRPARDIIEATIVLEAWAGRPARTAMRSARTLVSSGRLPPRGSRRVDVADDRTQSVLAEGVALVLSILSVAAWASPLSKAFGADVLADAIRIALPTSVALQWGLRSRYLCRRKGLALLARDGLRWCVPVLTVVLATLAMMPRWGPIAALLVTIWVAGAVMTSRGWGMLYAVSLAACAVALDDGAQAYVVLGALAAMTVPLAVAAVVGRRAPTDERAGSAPRALVAVLLGGSVGTLLVADPTLGWGVHGVHPAIALVPSVIGSFWGGYYLWNLYRAVPRGLSGVPLKRASRVGIADPAMSVFLGSVLRLIAAAIVLSGVVLALGRWTGGVDKPGVFVAFGCVALVSMLVGLLESLACQRAALVAVAAALGAELAWPHLVGWHVPGAALSAGALVGVLLAVVPLTVLLARSGRLLATRLWIQ
jgi:hypothetical protein